MFRSIFKYMAGSLVFALLLLTGCTATMDQQYYDDRSLIDDFEYLSEYGEWMDHPEYGEVWFPYVIAEWRPFQNGHWIWTNSRWAWTSYEPFGWLVYHYGYWGYETAYGWFWVPDDIWEPARVEWYTFGPYTGWAPLPPPGIRWPDPWDPYEIDIWIVVDHEHFTNEDIGRHIVRRPLYGDRTWTERVDRHAPDVREIERSTKRTVPSIEVRERNTDVRTREDRSRTTRRRITLPKTEKRKVERHEPRVRREVLKREKKTPEKKTEPKRKRR